MTGKTGRGLVPPGVHCHWKFEASLEWIYKLWIQNKVKDENPNQDVIFFHSIIHQESLRKLASWLNHVVHHVIKLVNFIRPRRLQCHQFITVLEEIDTDHQDLLYHSSPPVKFGQSVSMIVWVQGGDFWTCWRRPTNFLSWASRTDFGTMRLLSTHFHTWMSWKWSYREESVCAQHAQMWKPSNPSWLSSPGKFTQIPIPSKLKETGAKEEEIQCTVYSHWMYCRENSAVGFLI